MRRQNDKLTIHSIKQKSNLAAFANAGGDLLPAATSIVDDVRRDDEICNLALFVSVKCASEKQTLKAVLAHPLETMQFLKHLRKCVA